MSLTIDFSRSINPAFLIPSPSIPQTIQKVLHTIVPLLNAHARSRSALSYILLAVHMKDLAQECMDVITEKRNWDDVKFDMKKTALAVCHLTISIWYPFLYLVGSETFELISRFQELNEGSNKLESTAQSLLQSLYLISLVRESPTWSETFKSILDKETLGELGFPLYSFQTILKGISLLPLAFRKIKDLQQFPLIIRILVAVARVTQALYIWASLSFPKMSSLPIDKVEQMALVGQLANYSAKCVRSDLSEQLSQLFENIILFSSFALPLIHAVTAFPNFLAPWDKSYHIGVSGTPVKLDDVVGCEEPKKSILMLIDQLKQPEKYENLCKKPSPMPSLKGIIFYGPPGTGKSMVAKAFATEMDAIHFLEQEGSSFVNLYVGAGPKNIRSLFSKATQLAKENPKRLIVVFIDEINAIAAKRTGGTVGEDREDNRTTEAFLVAMDHLPSNVIVIGTTNAHPNDLDPAFIRSGRMDQKIEFKLPKKEERKEIFKKLISNYKTHSDINEEFYERIANQTDEWNYADFDNLIKQSVSTTGYERHGEITTSTIEKCLETLRKQANTLPPVVSLYIA